MTRQARWNEEEGGFEISLDGEPAVLRVRELADGSMDFASTFVPEEKRGGGIGGTLVRQALDQARERGWRVVPSCPFVESWIEEHPEYGDLVAPRDAG